MVDASAVAVASAFKAYVDEEIDDVVGARSCEPSLAQIYSPPSLHNSTQKSFHCKYGLSIYIAWPKFIWKRIGIAFLIGLEKYIKVLEERGTVSWFGHYIFSGVDSAKLLYPRQL